MEQKMMKCPRTSTEMGCGVASSPRGCLVGAGGAGNAQWSPEAAGRNEEAVWPVSLGAVFAVVFPGDLLAAKHLQPAPALFAKGRQRKKKNRRTYQPIFLEIFWRFSGLILENIFMVFLGSSCRETAKNAIKKKSMGKYDRKKVFFFSTFSAKSF
jgi:hypothetical protein